MSEDTPDLPFLEAPADGVPGVISTARELEALFADLSSGSGPIAFDAERAHGHRYWPKAYLFQLRRAGVGTALIDPIAFETAGATDLSGLVTAAPDAEWIVHAATQDLPSMVADRIVPPSLFDTELAARLLDYPLVGLAALVERHFGVRLRKAHSADNWATRPLPTSWLSYAALDVEHLIELRGLLADELAEAGKDEWARQEFEHELTVARRPVADNPERWRRMSGLRDVRTRRGLAVARALWNERDAICRAEDRPPGRLLPDSGIVALAQKVTDTGPLPGASDLQGVREFGYRGARRYTVNWLRAIGSVDRLPTKDWPEKRPPREGVGMPKNWGRRHPEAAARWERTRPEVDALAAELHVAPSLLVQPAALREVVFAPADDLDAQLTSHDVRPWQVEAISPVLRRTLPD